MKDILAIYVIYKYYLNQEWHARSLVIDLRLIVLCQRIFIRKDRVVSKP